MNNPDRISINGKNSGNPANLYFEMQIAQIDKGKEGGMMDPLNANRLQIKSVVAIDN